MKKLLEQMKEYIEECEETISWELAGGLTVEELIMNKEMPQIYDDVLFALSKL
jgi:hypothetical protein